MHRWQHRTMSRRRLCFCGGVHLALLEQQQYLQYDAKTRRCILLPLHRHHPRSDAKDDAARARRGRGNSARKEVDEPASSSPAAARSWPTAPSCAASSRPPAPGALRRLPLLQVPPCGGAALRALRSSPRAGHRPILLLHPLVQLLHPPVPAGRARRPCHAWGLHLSTTVAQERRCAAAAPRGVGRGHAEVAQEL